MTAGVIAITLIVVATTVDDAVWLIPYCNSPHLPTYTKVVHSITFVLTLECLAIANVCISGVFEEILLHHYDKSSTDISSLLSLTGAIICWVLAIGLYIKKRIKLRRRAMAATVNICDEEDNSLLLNSRENVEVDNEFDSENDDKTCFRGGDISSAPSIWVVVSLTTLGALDEMSYFPALLFGRVFSPSELCIGTLLASGMILVIVLVFLSKFKPLVDFLDGIPLHDIVGIFAVILTVKLII